MKQCYRNSEAVLMDIKRLMKNDLSYKKNLYDIFSLCLSSHAEGREEILRSLSIGELTNLQECLLPLHEVGLSSDFRAWRDGDADILILKIQINKKNGK